MSYLTGEQNPAGLGEMRFKLSRTFNYKLISLLHNKVIFKWLKQIITMIKGFLLAAP